MAQRWRAVVESVVNVVLTAAVLLSVVVIHKREVDGRSGLPKPRELQVNDWTGLRKSGQTIGTTSAPIQILVFADYQCPACRYLHYALRDLRLKLHDSDAFTYLHFPLPYHARALEAATGAECAAEQNTFESIQNALYSLQDSLAAMSMVRIASRAGVADLQAFSRCLGRADTSTRILVSMRAAEKIATRGTPTVIVNGWVLPGVPSLQELELRSRRVLSIKR